jgi:uncharacterized protein involved in response to NO
VAWLETGFRPFFLLAVVFAPVALAQWLWVLQGGVLPAVAGGAAQWHAHEMIFGYTFAVIAGFLLTAARRWTGLETARGGWLLALAVAWVAGRAAMSGWVSLPAPWRAGVDLLAPLGLLVAVGRPILKAKLWRNLIVLFILSALAGANGLYHLSTQPGWEGWSNAAVYGGLHLVVLLNVVIGGRVIPMFTRNKVKDASIQNEARLDLAALSLSGATAALAVAEATWALGVVAALAGVANLARMRRWGWRAALREPMLAVLHAGYLWIALGQWLLSVSVLTGALPLSVALHALTIGVIGGMTLGMIARVTLGHTGREIEATRGLQVAFVLVNAAALARLSAAALPPSLWRASWWISAGLLGAAFALALVELAPALVRRRVDGQPG